MEMASSIVALKRIPHALDNFRKRRKTRTPKTTGSGTRYRLRKLLLELGGLPMIAQVTNRSRRGRVAVSKA